VSVDNWFCFLDVQIFKLYLCCPVGWFAQFVGCYLVFEAKCHLILLLPLFQYLLCCSVWRLFWSYGDFAALGTQILISLQQLPFSLHQNLSGHKAAVLFLSLFLLQELYQIQFPTLINIVIKHIHLMLFVLFHVFEILLKATTGFWHRWMVHDWVSFSVSHMCMSFQIKRRQLLELLSQIVLSDFTLWILWNFTVDFWWRQMGRRIRGVFRLCLWTCSYWVMLLFQGYSWCLLIFIIQSLCLIHMVIFIIFIFIFYCYFLGSCRTW